MEKMIKDSIIVAGLVSIILLVFTPQLTQAAPGVYSGGYYPPSGGSNGGNSQTPGGNNGGNSQTPGGSNGGNSQTSGRNAALQNSVTELERQSYLSDKDFVFDFLNAPSGVSRGDGGRTVAATAANFPAVIGHGVAMTVGYIGPCGINLPHTHPRATEINFIVKGTFQAGLFQENGARFITNTLVAGQATVFPQGGIHFEQNLNCEEAMFVAAFNSADPGVQTTANSFLGGLPANVVGASLGGLNITTVQDLARYLPDNPALGIEECRRRCGIKPPKSS